MAGGRGYEGFGGDGTGAVLDPFISCFGSGGSISDFCVDTSGCLKIGLSTGFGIGGCKISGAGTRTSLMGLGAGGDAAAGAGGGAGSSSARRFDIDMGLEARGGGFVALDRIVRFA